MYNISANTIFTGKTLIYLPTCHSTNDYASRLIAEGNSSEGMLIVTPDQTAGKGQRGTVWESETAKNLTFSLILKPFFLKVPNQFHLNIITSLAVRETVAYFLQTPVKVKWPNDIYLNDKKIAGILIQNFIQRDTIGTSIVGIGLNVNQEVFSDKKAISMRNHALENFSVKEVLARLLDNLETYYEKLRNHELELLTREYTTHLYRGEEKQPFKAGDKIFMGKITGIDESGRLLIVDSDNQQLAFSFKEVEFVF